MFLDETSIGSNGNTSRQIGFPEGVAIDWVARNLYWTDSGKKTIEVARMDVTKHSKSKPIIRRVLFDQQIQNPRGIAIHPSARYIIVRIVYEMVEESV